MGAERSGKLEMPLVIPAPSEEATQAGEETELAQRAAKVETDANHELQRLIPLLNLSAAQQDAVFRALAANNVLWSPAMQVPSATEAGRQSGVSRETAGATDAVAGDTTGAIMPYLDDEQQTVLLNDYLDREEWWGDVLPRLLADTEAPGLTGEAAASADPTTAPATTTPVESAPAVKAYEGEEILLDP